MWTLTSSALLASLLVIGSSLPHPDDSAYKIPDVGSGDRSQYYVLHSDGTFKYGYDTGDGAFESAMVKPGNPLSGRFGYVDPDGEKIHLEYEAGVGGFVARGDHLPKPSPELARAIADVISRSSPFIDPLAGSRTNERAYGFKFDSDDYSRTEQSDSDGVVTGSYSYIDEFGHKREFKYKAGKGIGFEIEGDGLTIPVDETHTIGSVVRTSATRRPSRPSSTGHVSHRSQTRRQFSSSPIAFTRSEDSGDASYSFSYSADDHSRHESSDSDLNVQGSFSFDADDGETKRVSYVAGSGTGFKATGSHFPVAPTADFGRRTTSRRTSFTQTSPKRTTVKKTRIGTTGQTHRRSHSTVGQTQRRTSTHTGTAQAHRAQTHHQHGQRSSVSHHRTPSAVSSTHTGTVQTHRAQTHHGQRSSVGQHHTPSVVSHAAVVRDSSDEQSFSQIDTQRRDYEEANIQATHNRDGSYSVFYENSDHARFETGDSDNNVEGSFSFRDDDDGERHMLTYEAGRETGFIVDADHLPEGPSVPGASSGIPTGRLEKVVSTGFVDPLADDDLDPSYNFGFESDTYSRTETADEDGNVEGTYTIVDENGLVITYAFRAGKGIGFETREISRKQGPRPAKPTPYTGPLAHSSVGATRSAGSSFSSLGATRTTGSSTFGAGARGFEHANIRSSSDNDGSYSFSYGTSTHSRDEEGDSDNSVDGKFSFIADDGEERTVRYSSGRDTGFIAKGVHLPIGPEVPGAPSGQTTGRLVKVSSTPFIDPLARSSGSKYKSDASYSFNFDSDSYSRTETADEDGNVVGTYDVQQEDGTIITYRFRAGKGIGFEVEEVSRRQGGRPLSATHSTISQTQQATQSHTGTAQTHRAQTHHQHGQRSSVSHHRTPSKLPTTFKSGSAASHVSGTSRTSGSRNTGAQQKLKSTTSAFHRVNHAAKPQVRTSTKTTHSSTSRFSSPSFRKSSDQSFRVEGDDFVLRTYGPGSAGGKYGYVINYD